VAFPNADIKFYLTAQTIERARRRQAELKAAGRGESLEQIQRAIEERDKSDQSRSVGPLTPAGDAVVIDTTDLSVEEVVSRLEFIVRSSSINYELPTMNNEQPKMRWFRFARWFCKIFCMTFFRLHRTGLENVPHQGPLVLICNHQSFLDPVLCGIFVKRPLFFLARDSLFRGFFGWLIASVNTIPVKRGAPDLSAIKTIISKLKEGNAVCLFPEATRSSDGRIATFKPGFGLLCRRGNAKVVPVLIDGAFESWPKHKKLFSPGGQITICYGKYIPAGEVKKMGDRKLAELLTHTLRQMQNDCRVKQGKKPYNYTDLS
jgi:1-acyl-sn-glycerol-3-phosphate acyltransferase